MGEKIKIIGLVVAAGYSSRMGKFKPLLPLGNETVIENSVKSFLRAGIDDIRVVVGHRGQELIPILNKLGVQIIINENYDQGMFSSIIAGIKSFEPEVDGFLLLPGDNPLIRQGTIKELLTFYREHDWGIVYPSFNGERGHPPVISSRYIPKILSWNQSGGMKALLSQFENEAYDLTVVDQGILLDMDNYLDYQEMLGYYAQRDIPTVEECRAILYKYNVQSKIINHGKKVSQVACRLASVLDQSGYRLNIKLVMAAGLLHDIAKGQPNHAEAGAKIIRELGYYKVADVIQDHTDIKLEYGQEINENEVVYLADKLIQGENFVTLQDRFKGSLEKYREAAEIHRLVKNRLINAEIIKGKIEKLIKAPIVKILSEPIEEFIQEVV